MKKCIIASLILFVSLTGCSSDSPKKEMVENTPDKHVFGFYYNWYGNTAVDGKEIHWAHGVIQQNNDDGPAEFIPGGENLASNFYPELKNYSSTDSATIARHMQMMAQARIDVVVVTWWRDSDYGIKALPIHNE